MRLTIKLSYSYKKRYNYLPRISLL